MNRNLKNNLVNGCLPLFVFFVGSIIGFCLFLIYEYDNYSFNAGNIHGPGIGTILIYVIFSGFLAVGFLNIIKSMFKKS